MRDVQTFCSRQSAASRTACFLNVSFSFIRTAKRETKKRTVAASRPRYFATSLSLIAQPPDKYKSDQRPRLRDFPASICSFKHCETRRSTASYAGESRPR